MHLRDYIGVLRLRKWSIILVTLLVVTATMFFSLRQTPIYKSNAKVLVKPVSLSPNQPYAVPPNLETERELASSLAVADVAAENLNDSDSAGTLIGGVSVAVDANTEILVISYSHPDPREAQRRAQAVAEAYLEFRREQITEDLLVSSESIRDRLTDVNDQLVETNRQIQATEDEKEKAALETRANTLVSQVAVLQQQLSALTVPENLRVGEIVEPANLPLAPSSPKHIQNAILALLVGIVLGVGVAFLRERLDDRVRDTEELETAARVPVLATVPPVSRWRRRKKSLLVTRVEPHSAASEAYKTLRTRLLLTSARAGARTILVTSAQPEEGKTTTTANLGVALAEAGKRVILVSADLRKPRLHDFLGVANDVGLVNVLAGEIAVESALLKPGLDNLRVLPSGPAPKKPVELLGSQEMKRVLRQLREAADLVLIDTAPVLSVADAITLASTCDAVLLVASAEQSRTGAVEHARAELAHIGASILGSVLNKFDRSKTPGDYYYRGHYYYADRGHEGLWEPTAEEPAARRA